jgi:serine/threonine-protein kinase RsbW
MAELYRRRFPATPEMVPVARHDVIDALTQAGLTDPGLHAHVALALTEATANAVRHAYPADRTERPVEVTVTRSTDVLLVTVADEGLGMDSRMPTGSGGMGLAIMGGQTQDLAIESDHAGTLVKLQFGI